VSSADTVATVALALVAAIALLLNGASARESYRSRIDSVAQRVVIAKLYLDDGVFTRPNLGYPQSVAPGTAWPIPQYAAELLMVRANVIMQNEGSVTVFAKVDDPPLEAAFGSIDWNEATIQDGWALIPPKFEAILTVSLTRSSQEWWDDLLNKGSQDECPTRFFTIEFRDATSNALDKCECEFGREFFGKDPHNGGCVILPPLLTSTPRPIVERVGIIVRTYPHESTWYQPLGALFKKKSTA
jgi:hypothetical protein